MLPINHFLKLVKMKLFRNPLLILAAFLFLASCSSDDAEEKDQEKPAINIAFEGGFPEPCVGLVRGETYTFRAKATDNVSLAAYSLDIHHNFDHHTHDDQQGDCELEPVKQAVNPWIFMENYSIEGGVRSYEITIELTIPQDIDPGNYHCSYSVTDHTGWQSRTSVDITIVE